MPAWTAALLAGACLAAPGDDPGLCVVNDFENENAVVAWGACTYERVPDGSGGAGHAAKWTCPGEKRDAILYLESAPADITAWNVVRFRMRRVSDTPCMVYLRIFSSPEDDLNVRVPGVGKEWRTFEVDLDSLSEKGSPNPRAVKSIAFSILQGRSAVFLVDDVVLDVRRLPAAPEADKRAAAKTWTVADFESAGWEEWTDTKASGVSVEGDKGGKHLKWALEGGANPAAVYLHDIPKDLRAWRFLRFRIRAEGDPGQPVSVRFTAGYRDCIRSDLKVPAKKWTDVEMPILLMEELGTFDLARLECLSLQVYRGAACTILLDDVRLERGATDAAAEEKDRFEYAFGKGGAGKGIHVRQGDFDVWTDSRGALPKFPEGLEKAETFVRETLGLPPPRRRLDVYLFQNPGGLHDFLARARGMDKKKADALMALGNASYLALVYRAPDDPQFVHELTHSLFHRARGRLGGSWFHEGIGKYVESRWQGKKPAEEFAPRLRSKAFVPLATLVAMPDLFAGTDLKGGAGTPESLYLQAAALQEFLRRGPLKEKWAAAEPAVARMDAAPDKRAAALEALLGMTLGDLERAWIAWGSDPPGE
jgi:hypothetical protein